MGAVGVAEVVKSAGLGLGVSGHRCGQQRHSVLLKGKNIKVTGYLQGSVQPFNSTTPTNPPRLTMYEGGVIQRSSNSEGFFCHDIWNLIFD